MGADSGIPNGSYRKWTGKRSECNNVTSPLGPTPSDASLYRKGTQLQSIMASRKVAIHRRKFIRSLCTAIPVFSFDQLVHGLPLGVRFVNVAREAGLKTKTIFGGEAKNKFLMETTGCGCAFFDYDNDGWLDIFLVNGTRFEAHWAPDESPVS